MLFLSRGTKNAVYKLYCSGYNFLQVWSQIQTPAVNYVYTVYSFNSLRIYSHIEGITYTLRYTNYLYDTYMFKIVLCYTHTGQMSKTVTAKFYTRIANVMAIYKYHPDHAEYDRVSREIVKNILF